MKYRIVSRNTSPYRRRQNGSIIRYLYYYAQFEVFGVWIDCRYNPLVDGYDSYDPELSVVERWVNAQIERISPEEKVVKTYD